MRPYPPILQLHGFLHHLVLRMQGSSTIRLGVFLRCQVLAHLMPIELDQDSARSIMEHNEDAEPALQPATPGLATAPEPIAASAVSGAVSSATSSITSRNFGEVLRHELNNPLTGILGNAELLLGDISRQNIDLPASVKQRVETIAALAVRMRECVRALSDRWELESAQARQAPDSTDSPPLFH